MAIKIYDIDGTLTKVKGDNAAEDAFESYAFWPLISYHFAKNPEELRRIAKAWGASDKGVGARFIESSTKMLQTSIEHFQAGVNGEKICARARDITLQFNRQDIIRFEAIAHLRKSLEAGDTCVLSTGSYQDGAVGFVAALIQEALLPDTALEQLVFSGATVDWQSQKVTHANIADNKIKGLRSACKAKSVTFDVADIAGIYVDDPLGNDSGICALSPQQVRLIRTHKNKDQRFVQFHHTDWDEINAEQLPAFRP